jgi:hypothetical protein
MARTKVVEDPLTVFGTRKEVVLKLWPAFCTEPCITGGELNIDTILNPT